MKKIYKTDGKVIYTENPLTIICTLNEAHGNNIKVANMIVDVLNNFDRLKNMFEMFINTVQTDETISRKYIQIATYESYRLFNEIRNISVKEIIKPTVQLDLFRVED